MEILFKIELHFFFFFAKSNSVSTIKVISVYCVWWLLVLDSQWLVQANVCISHEAPKPLFPPPHDSGLPASLTQGCLFQSLQNWSFKVLVLGGNSIYPPLEEANGFKKLLGRGRWWTPWSNKVIMETMQKVGFLCYERPGLTSESFNRCVNNLLGILILLSWSLNFKCRYRDRLFICEW